MSARYQEIGFQFVSGLVYLGIYVTHPPTRLHGKTLGLKLPGLVTNVTAFGAFVDIGVHQDGLVHISQMSDQFVKNPAEVLKVGQRVMATVTEVDLPRKRIALSLKSKPELGNARKGDRPSRDGDRGGKPAGPRTGGGGNNPFGNVDWFTAAQSKKH